MTFETGLVKFPGSTLYYVTFCKDLFVYVTYLHIRQLNNLSVKYLPKPVNVDPRGRPQGRPDRE